MQKEETRRIYGVRINARLLNSMLSNIGALKRASKNGNISKEFEERIMLGVTQVNGCQMCSYYHTAESLKLGMNKQEIDSMLGGEFSDVPEDELPAIMFAQHYAETIGKPDKEVLEKLVEHYGKETARDILAYIRAIMVGNAQGNIVGALRNRIKGKPEQNSSISKELSVLFCDVFLMPVLLLKALITMPFRLARW